MQSLKSTAFAVTLLAISFGLYCVSSNKPVSVPEADMVDPIRIDESYATQSAPIELAPSNIGSQVAPIQVSTNITPKFNNSLPSVPDLQLPQLQSPQLQTPNLQTPQLQSPNLNAGFSPNKPMVQTPTLTQSAPVLSQSPSPLKLPEFATRQPVSTSPELRDDGLIGALKTDDFDARNQFAAASSTFNSSNNPPLTVTQPGNSDSSYNSLASKEEDVATVNSTAGSLGTLGMPDLENNTPAKPAPTSISGVWTEVDRLIAEDDYRGALGVLSRHYGRKGLTGPQRQKLQGWLDALAGKVIYSTEHLFVKQPHVVQAGETLDSIARQFNIPGEVVYNINRAQFGNSNEVSAGMHLKVVNGPFHAEVNLETKMMTLFVKNLYAGRFPVAVGISGNPDEGNYDVKVKSPAGYTWRDANGKEYPAGTPGNGYGPYWMGLSGSLCIHAVPSGTPQGHRGCIGLTEKDAKDVYGILSKNSQISIVR